MGGLPHDIPIPDDPDDPSVEIHELFAVCTTARSYLFKRRLTQAQYEFLVALWGVPEWYRYFLPKHEFRVHVLSPARDIMVIFPCAL